MTFLEFYEALLLCALRWGATREDRGGCDGVNGVEAGGCGGEGDGKKDGEGEEGGGGCTAVELKHVFCDFFEGQFLPRARELLHY